MEATQGALIRLERWSEYWYLPLNPSKCEASFFSVDPHRDNLQPNLLLLGSRLRFNPTPTFLEVTFDHTLSFSKHISSLKIKFFPRLKAIGCISASSWGSSKDSLSLLYKAFLKPLLTYASPGWFPFLIVTNFTKLERLHRAASRAITGCLTSSSIPLLLFETFLPRLRVTLSHFIPSFYERSLCLPTFFPISGLARPEVKTRLCRLSWRVFVSTHTLMPFLLFLGRLSLLALFFLLGICLPSLWSSTLSASRSYYDPPLSRQCAALVHVDCLLPHNLILWTDGSVPFAFGKGGFGILANFSAGPICSSFSAEACAILQSLCWSRQHQQVCHFSSLLLLSDSRCVVAIQFSPPSFLLSQTLWQIRQELSSLSFCSIKLQ